MNTLHFCIPCACRLQTWCAEEEQAHTSVANSLAGNWETNNRRCLLCVFFGLHRNMLGLGLYSEDKTVLLCGATSDDGVSAGHGTSVAATEAALTEMTPASYDLVVGVAHGADNAFTYVESPEGRGRGRLRWLGWCCSPLVPCSPS